MNAKPSPGYSLVGSLALGCEQLRQEPPPAPAQRALTGEERGLLAEGLLPANYAAMIAAAATPPGAGPPRGSPARSPTTSATRRAAGGRALRQRPRGATTLPAHGPAGQPGLRGAQQPQELRGAHDRRPVQPRHDLHDPAAAPGSSSRPWASPARHGRHRAGPRAPHHPAPGLANEHATLRILRPTGAREAQRRQAIAFAAAQLGKPYNYTFSDTLGGDRAFYCSSLASTGPTRPPASP